MWFSTFSIRQNYLQWKQKCFPYGPIVPGILATHSQSPPPVTLQFWYIDACAKGKQIPNLKTITSVFLWMALVYLQDLSLLFLDCLPSLWAFVVSPFLSPSQEYVKSVGLNQGWCKLEVYSIVLDCHCPSNSEHLIDKTEKSFWQMTCNANFNIPIAVIYT